MDVNANGVRDSWEPVTKPLKTSSFSVSNLQQVKNDLTLVDPDEDNDEPQDGDEKQEEDEVEVVKVVRPPNFFEGAHALGFRSPQYVAIGQSRKSGNNTDNNNTTNKNTGDEHETTDKNQAAKRRKKKPKQPKWRQPKWRQPRRRKTNAVTAVAVAEGGLRREIWARI